MSEINRREFVQAAAGVSVALGMMKAARPANARVLGANDRINLGIIGVGGRGNFLLGEFMSIGTAGGNVQIAAVADVYEKRRRLAAERAKCKGFLDYREIIQNKEIEGVVVATPDHWHAAIAIAAMNAGKDVYLEKPMTRTIEEARRVYETSVKTKRILQVGVNGSSGDQWRKARKALEDGMIGKLVMSQGSVHRNWDGKQQPRGEWNWRIDPDAGPAGKGDNYVDWKMWLGSAPKRSWSPDRFFRFRKYWDYNGGIATDLFYHSLAPLNLMWNGGQGEFPLRVAGSGGIWVFKDEREVPDTFMLVADYPSGHSVVLTSSMANATHTPSVIRGYDGSIDMSPGTGGGAIVITPERHAAQGFKEKWGAPEVRLALESRPSHYQNFIDCMRSREQPVLPGLPAYKTMAAIAMSVESYRTGRTLFFDEAKQKVANKPPRGAAAKPAGRTA
jgi:predicted dehydrogenase